MPLTLYSLLKIYLRQAWKVLLTGAAFGGLAYVICDRLTPYYSFQALVQVANFKGLQPDSQTRSERVSMIGAEAPTLKKEALGYILFKFYEMPVQADAAAYLKKAEEVRGSDMIQITTLGKTQADAKAYAEMIVQDLQKKYESTIDDLIRDTKSQVELFSTQIISLTQSLKEIKNAIHEIGFTNQLLQQKNEMELLLIHAQTQKLRLESDLSVEKTYNFYIKEAYAPFTKPSHPKVFLIVGAAVLLGILMMMFLIYLKEEDRTVGAPRATATAASATAATTAAAPSLAPSAFTSAPKPAAPKNPFTPPRAVPPPLGRAPKTGFGSRRVS